VGGCFTPVNPAEISKESFSFGLTVARLLPHADWILAVPLRQTFGGECLLNHTESNLHPADDFRSIQTAGEAPELDRSF